MRHILRNCRTVISTAQGREMTEREAVIKGLNEMIGWLESYYPNLLTDDLVRAIAFLEREYKAECDNDHYAHRTEDRGY